MTATLRDDLDAPVEARAVARFVPIAPRKARRVVDLIRGLPAERAVDILRFAPQAASEPVRKVLESAMANAENNLQLDRGTLRIARTYVDGGPIGKRWRARAQGRPGPLHKRTCHITVVVEPVEDDATPAGRAGAGAGKKAAAKSQAKKASAKKSTAKKAPAGKKASASPSDGEESTAKKSTGKKSTAKQSGAGKKTAEKATKTTKKAAAKKATGDTTGDTEQSGRAR